MKKVENKRLMNNSLSRRAAEKCADGSDDPKTYADLIEPLIASVYAERERLVGQVLQAVDKTIEFYNAHGGSMGELRAAAAALRANLEGKFPAPEEGWIACSERLPEPGIDVLLWLVAPRDPELADYRKRESFAVGHLDVNGYGKIITRPLTGPGEIVRQWPAWAITGDDDNYHEATHWRPLPSPPKRKEG